MNTIYENKIFQAGFCSGLVLKDQNSYAAGKTCEQLFKNTTRKQFIHAMT